MDNIFINKSIQPATPNTPLDARTVVSTEIDILNIKLPYVGMLVYVTSSDKTYQIKSLKESNVGPRSVPDTVVDTYEEFAGASSGVSKSSGDEYTAFEVSPNDYNMTHLMTICTYTIDYTKSDVQVDWGDGSKSVISSGGFEHSEEYADKDFNVAHGEYNYTMRHTYKDAGKYIVKVYGKGYYRIKGYSAIVSSGHSSIVHSNLISDIFNDSFPLSDHITNISGMCYHADNLTHVNAYALKNRIIKDASYLFYDCPNLVRAEGFVDSCTEADCYNMFAYCSSLEFSDAKLPLCSNIGTACDYMYYGCISLNVKVNTLIPSVTGTGPYSMDCVFYGCVSIPDSGIPANKLWLTHSVTEFCNTESAFLECSKSLRGNVPMTWGGTAEDPKVYLVQVDWSQTDEHAIDYIKNKPRLQDLEGYEDLVSRIKSEIMSGISGVVSEYEYVNESGMYQGVRTTQDGDIVDNGDPQEIDSLYVYDTGTPDPEY